MLFLVILFLLKKFIQTYKKTPKLLCLLRKIFFFYQNNGIQTNFMLRIPFYYHIRKLLWLLELFVFIQ